MRTISTIPAVLLAGCRKLFGGCLFAVIISFLHFSGLAKGQAGQQAIEAAGKPMKTLNVREMTVGELAALLSYSGAIQTVASQEAACKTVSIFLQNVSAPDALQAICRSAGLVCRLNADGVSFILTQQEFSASQGLYNDEVVETIQLRYATALDVGESLRNLFADRLVWIAPSENSGNAENQIGKALNRMDLLSEYEEFARGGDSDSDADSSNSSRDYRRNDNSRERSSGSSSRRTGSSSNSGTRDFAMLERYRSLIREQQPGETLMLSDATSAVSDAARFGVVFVSAFPSTNMLLLRSTDSRALEQIKTAVDGLDRPTPQVLLEVKVLELDLGAGESMGVDWLLQVDDFYAGSSGNRAGGGINTLPVISASGGVETAIANQLTSSLGFNPRTAVIGVISDRLLARMQFMESQGRLAQLATPTLLVADDEASRIFIGSQSQFLKEVRRSSVVISEGGQTTGGELTPELEEQRIGMNLLITPRIHADRSVTLRVLQEETDFGETRSINYGGIAAIEVQDIQHRSVVSTIVAHDGNWVIIGGLLRESVSEKESGIPVLMDIPLLGRLFKNTGKSRTRSELIIMIRPMVLVAPGDDVSLSRELLERLSRHPSAATIFENNRKELDFPPPPEPVDKKSGKKTKRKKNAALKSEAEAKAK